jgi:hypothetical protein
MRRDNRSPSKPETKRDRRDEDDYPDERESSDGPAKKFKMSVGTASIEVTIWENQVKNQNGRGTFTVYNTTISRSYKDDRGEWHNQERPNFRVNEIPILNFLLTQAAMWILEQKER